MEKVRTYRKNAGIIVFNKDKKILVCERKFASESSWQMPQGGIDEGESIADATIRELYEETSIKSARIVKTLEEPIRYLFPEHVKNKLWKIKGYDKFFGQDQYWSLLYFFGDDREIDIKTEHPEFKNFKWESIDFVINNIIDFKKESYTKAFSKLKPYLDEFEEF